MTGEERERPGTLAVFAEWTADRYADHPALRFTRDGSWHTVSYTGLRDTVRAVGQGLMGLGVRAGDRIAVLAETRPEWTYAHLASLAAGAVVVPVYPTAGAEELRWVLGDSGASVVICENAAQADRVESLRDTLPAVRHLVLMDPQTGSETQRGAETRPVAGERPGAGTRTAGERPALLALPGPAPLEALLARARRVRPDDEAGIVYTSGTTGPPKGCRLLHGNLGAIQDATLPLVDGGPGDRTYLYLPLAHVLAQLTQFSTLIYGGELCYFGGRIENVVAELAQAQPTHLPSVPRLFEKVHASVLALAGAREGGREWLEEAVRIGLLAADGVLPPELTDAYKQADEQFYGLVRAAFGGRLRWGLTGAAPIATGTLDLLRACGIAVYEGYGMTESGGVISLNHPGAERRGTVGRPIAGCEVRIAADGEVLARGPMVFPGYHANPGASAEVLDDEGWLHTGDLGSLDPDGYLSITGRKKDLIITSAGKNLAPAEVELAIERSPYVSHAVMVGDRRPYPVALITVDPLETGDADPAAVRSLVQEAVDAANAQVARPARIRAFAVLEKDFSIGDGVLTPTLKVRRRAVLERYADVIDGLYGDG
ncbi:AMP-dependent synthetase/ligase [Streptomyces sp. NBC_00306]|uniref:AMP-dependent synthetase/ligase n=1 Tax=Streptomyces sp. NBC_00306 TaxID=2975708 RepID=UPI002E2DD966|nr:long-chain fatty acid--CoA ligase [Streptomyces sp. NBC_00306]